VVPWLATSWKYNPDALAGTLTLRKGVKFHDGTDFNAEAVKWNMEKYKDAGRTELQSVKSIDVIDDYTVRLNLSHNDSILLSDLACYHAALMISPTAYEKHGEEWCEKHPVGTGPFKFVSWEEDVAIKYERFDDYWQEGKPYLDGIEWHIIKDPVTLLVSLQAGELNAARVITPKNAADMKALGLLDIVANPANIQVILSDGSNPDSPFADVRVRQAMSYAINRQELCDTLGYGYWQPANQISVPGHPAYNPDVVGYPYNPEKTRELLVKAGYPDGFKATFYAANAPAETVDVVKAVQGYLAKVGIDVDIDMMDMATFGSTIAIGPGWENGICTWFINTALPHELQPIDVFFGPANFLVKSAPKPAECQEVIVQAKEAADPETRDVLIRELQKMAIDKYCIVTPLFMRPYIGAKYPKMHDEGPVKFVDIQWSGADAWLSK